MMNFPSRTETVGPKPKEWEKETRPRPESIFSEVVLIDKSNELAPPLVYQFRHEIAHFPHPFEKNAFILLGGNNRQKKTANLHLQQTHCLL